MDLIFCKNFSKNTVKAKWYSFGYFILTPLLKQVSDASKFWVLWLIWPKYQIRAIWKWLFSFLGFSSNLPDVCFKVQMYCIFFCCFLPLRRAFHRNGVCSLIQGARVARVCFCSLVESKEEGLVTCQQNGTKKQWSVIKAIYVLSISLLGFYSWANSLVGIKEREMLPCKN